VPAGVRRTGVVVLDMGDEAAVTRKFEAIDTADVALDFHAWRALDSRRWSLHAIARL
jgi:hypothetical protein